MFAVYGLCAKNQVRERGCIDRLDLGEAPIVAEFHGNSIISADTDRQSALQCGQYVLRLGILLIAFAGLAISGERAFNGALEALTNGQIRLRLSDGRRVCVRLENTGPLSAQAILNSYRLGDRLEAVIDDGHAIFDNESGWEFPALKDLRFMRPADPDELPSFHMHRPWWIDHNLLPGAPSRGLPDVPAETASETPLERARRVNLVSYMAKLHRISSPMKRLAGPWAPR